MKNSIKESINNFEPFIRKGAILNAGSINDYNSMTIGWLTYGVLWSKKVVIVFVKPCRYTNSFMKRNDYFTVSLFEEKYQDKIIYFGTHSGRDVDKAKETGLNVVKYDENTITYKEAYETIKLKKIYTDELDKSLPKDIIDKYYLTEDRHTMFIGEVIE